MVSKKRLDFGYHGYRAPIVPKAPRSIRRRSPNKNSIEDSKLCAFELLAAVAGKLLQESESSASSNIADAKVQLDISQDGNKKGPPVDDKAVKSDSFEHGSCAESAFVPELSGTSDVLKKGDCDSKPKKVESGHETLSEDDKSKVVVDDLSKATNTIAVKDPNEECVNTDNILINSESSVQLPLYRVDPVPDALMQKHWNNVKLGIRDDDENSYGCKKSSTKVVNKPVRPQPHMGHRRIRKMLTSKYRKVAPKWKSCELYNNSERVKSFYQHRKRIYTQQRCQQAPIKKRKLSDHSFAAAYDQDTSSDSISSLPEKGMRKDKSGSGVVSETASGASATVKGHQRAKDRHVKFSIKSFRVPELYIEVPETASVASLKRTVMEAVTAILGRGIRVGVVLQGKKVRDDNRTLQQAGISQSNNLDSLGFMLEPSFTHVSPSKTPKKLPSILPCDADQESPRSPATPMIDSVISEASVDPPAVAKFDEDMQNNNELIASPQTPMDEEAVSDSKALVAVNSPDPLEALAVVPVNPKPKRSELSQRRTRRPFTVTEVEALVGAVEKLGTGRWRDVKMGAFENADHRTYVDLKDKWKTLVHTASISPQQRRGEPVPQELLDRVLSAHSYWSQHQSKQHGNGKNPVESTARTGEETVGA